MRLFALALTLSLADFPVASAQTATPDSENGRYSFNPVADGALRLDTRTGQVSQCSRRDVGIFDGHNDVLLRLYRRGGTVTERDLFGCAQRVTTGDVPGVATKSK